jgi:hypothetical protein
LTLFAVFAAGWVAFAWTTHWLEWRFLYDWWGAAFVEDHVGWFIPLIVARFAIPVLLARVLLAEGFDDGAPYPRREVWFLVGVKVLTVLLFTCGIGLVSVESDSYLEAAEETGIWTALSAGLL